MMRYTKPVGAWSIVVAVIWVTGIAIADEPKPNEAQQEAAPKEIENPFAQKAQDSADKESKISEKQIDQWALQLDSEKYAEREAATLKLIEAGNQAIKAASQAAQGESREAASRAVRVLKEIMQAGEPKAKAALEKLSKSDNERVARRAKKALELARDNRARIGFRPRVAFPRVQVQGKVLAIRLGNVNGEKTLNVTDNDTKIHITDSPTNGIKIIVTKKVNGKDKITKYEAKDKEDLKKNHPEGFKVYDKYMSLTGKNPLGGLQPRLQIQNNVFPQAIPAPQFGVPRAVVPQRAIVPRAFGQNVPGNAADVTKMNRLEKQQKVQAQMLRKAQERIDKLEAELKKLKSKQSGE